ncbi:MAG: alpha/beta fold hydrolase [Polyangiaceae bacterium]|nr:alpha/beta fold hydrolase [Polyangiaceae bacterium]
MHTRAIYGALGVWLLAHCSPAPPPRARAAAPPVATAAAPCPPSAAPPAAASDAPVSAAPPAALVLDGTPAVPAALRDRLGRYLETRAAPLASLSDDGRAVLVTTRFGQTAQTHLVRAPLGARTQLTFGGEPASRASFVPGRADAIVFATDAGGNEQFQLHRQDLATGEVRLLTDGRSRNESYAWAWDGSRLAYSSNARNGRDMDVWWSDGKSASASRLFLERSGHWTPLELSRDGKRLLLQEYVSINDSRIFLADTETGAVTRITPEAPVAAHRAAALDPSGQRLWLTSDRAGEFNELYEVDLSRPEAPWRPLSRHVSWNVEAVALSPDARSLAFTTNEDGYSVLRILDTASRRDRVVAGVPRGVISGLRFARRASVLGFTFSSATTPGDAYTYDLGRGRVERWTESELGGLPRERFAEPTLVRFPSFDGRSIPAFYYAAKGAGPRPVVVWIHGGPEAQARPELSALIQYLVAESGISVLVPNVRGSDGYGKTYLQADDGVRREDSVKDIGALLDWVATRPELDAKRVAVIGGSYGGYMVLASLVHFGERLAAGVDVVGIAHFVTFLENTSAYRRDLRRAEYGDERDPAMREHLTRISPATNAARIRRPLFVAHGQNDPRVPASEAEQIVAAVRGAGQEVWYMLARNEGHGFTKKENRDTFSLLAILFLEKHLGVIPR